MARTKRIDPETDKRVFRTPRRPRDRHYKNLKGQPIRWWDEDLDDKKRLSRAWNWVERLRRNLANSIWEDLFWYSVYTNRAIDRDNSYMTAVAANPELKAYLNLARSIVDTAISRLITNRPMPVISADDAEYDDQLFAKEVSRVLRRKMGSHHIDQLTPDIVRDMIVTGNGLIHTVRKGGDVSSERCPIWELVYDPQSGAATPARSLGRDRPIDRDVLSARFPKHSDEIQHCQAFNSQYPWLMWAYGQAGFHDHVELLELWHLESAPGAGDGCHLMCTRSSVLVCEPWTRERFPIAACHWSRPVLGMRGQGLVEDLAPIQDTINELLLDMQETLHFSGQGKWFVNGNSVNKNQLRNVSQLSIHEFNGQEPHFFPGAQINQSAMDMVNFWKSTAYQLSGINEQTASSQNTLGPGASGEAIRTLDDIQSNRFAHVEMDYQNFRVEIGRHQMDEAKAMYDEVMNDNVTGGANCETKLTKKTLAAWIKNHEWDRVDVDGGDYTLAIEPINHMAGTRSGKLQEAMDLKNLGLIKDPTTLAGLMNEPDIARANRSSLGPLHNLERIMSDLPNVKIPLDTLMPDSYMNVDLGIDMCKGELEEARSKSAKAPVVARYTAWIEAAYGEQNRRNNAASMPGMQSKDMVNAPSASDLPGGLNSGGGAPGGPPPGPPGPPGPAMPPGPPGIPGA